MSLCFWPWVGQEKQLEDVTWWAFRETNRFIVQIGRLIGPENNSSLQLLLRCYVLCCLFVSCPHVMFIWWSERMQRALTWNHILKHNMPSIYIFGTDVATLTRLFWRRICFLTITGLALSVVLQLLPFGLLLILLAVLERLRGEVFAQHFRAGRIPSPWCVMNILRYCYVIYAQGSGLKAPSLHPLVAGSSARSVLISWVFFFFFAAAV